jgi:hypothetical protein
MSGQLHAWPLYPLRKSPGTHLVGPRASLDQLLRPTNLDRLRLIALSLMRADHERGGGCRGYYVDLWRSSAKGEKIVLDLCNFTSGGSFFAIQLPRNAVTATLHQLSPAWETCVWSSHWSQDW